jgi:peptide/nickel transport system substrate-binding protein
MTRGFIGGEKGPFGCITHRRVRGETNPRRKRSMKENIFTKKIDRRRFLKDVALAGGAVFITASPTNVFAQEGKTPIPPMEIIYYTAVAEQDDIWKLVVQDWKKLGLESKLKVANSTVVAKLCYDEHNFGDMASFSSGPSSERLDPSFYLVEYLHSKNTTLGGKNFGHYINPEYDKYCDLQGAEIDRNKRRELVWKCQEIAAKDYPVWWMAYGASIQAYNSRDWEGIWTMPGVGIASRYGTPWTFFKIKSKTKRNALRVGDTMDFNTTNLFAANDPPTQQTLGWIYDTYTKITPDLETVPWAAESWRVVNSKTVDITLRSGMKFHDGNPVTVQDVKFSWDYTKKWRFPIYNWVTDTVEKTEILDDRNVRFTLVKPHAPFIDQTLAFAIILPKHIWEKIPESVGLKNPIDWDNPKCIGSGFFKLGHYRPSEELYLVANKDHWNAPSIDGVYYRIRMSPDAMVSALVAGEVDVTGDIRLAQAKSLERYNYLKVIQAPNHRVWMARPDMRRKPFGDREFRRALYHAVDLKKIYEVVFDKTGNEGRNTGIAPIFKFWHNSKIPPVDFSIEKARKILQDAGYSWDSNGRLCFPKGA